MRYKEFKVELREEDAFIDGEEITIPSVNMARKQFDKKITSKAPNPRKYINAIAKSIRKPKLFLWKINTKKKNTVKYGKIDKIFLIGAELDNDGNLTKIDKNDNTDISVNQWEKWASNLDTDAGDIIKFTGFSVDGEDLKLPNMLKTDAATGSLVPNLGDIAEAVLGAAITAKFIQGGRNIDQAMLIDVLKKVVVAKDKKARGITDYEDQSIANDQVTYFLKLNAKSTKGLKVWMTEGNPMDTGVQDFTLVKEYDCPDTTVKGMQEHVRNAVIYANTSDRAKIAVDKAKLDPKENLVEIISDGGEAKNQSTTKVDLKVLYDGTVTRLLSLKAGTVGQFGQVSGGTFESIQSFFEQTLGITLSSTFKTKFGFKTPINDKDSSAALFNFSKGPFKDLYDEAAKQVNLYVKDDNLAKEFDLVRTLYNNIVLHATRKEQGVTMVILSLNKTTPYKELAFDERLYDALSLYDLQMFYDQAKMSIQIYGVLLKDVATKKLGAYGAKLDPKALLVKFGSRLSGGSVRNLVEMGDLLKELADIEKLDTQQVKAQQQAAPADDDPDQSYIETEGPAVRG